VLYVPSSCVLCCCHRSASNCLETVVIQDDQKASVYLMITVQKTRYTEQSSRTQFGMSINVWRLVGDTLNITWNFLYCNYQVHRDFLITLYHDRHQ
jgi:hypothetical protein